MQTKFVTLTATLALLAAPALASGPVVAPTPAPIVVQPAPVGMDWTGPSIGLQLGYGNVDTSGAAILEGDGALYGLRAYYDYDFGDFIVGGGLQYDASDIDIGGVTTLDSVTRVGLRAGADLNRSWVYGTLGYAYAQTSNPAVGDSNGYFVGLGYEMLVADNVSVGAELLYHRFEDFDLGGLDVEATTAAISVNYRF